MGKTNTNNTQNTNNQQNNRKPTTEHHKMQGVANAASKAGKGIKSAVGYTVNLFGRSVGEVAVDTFAAGAGVAAGVACGKFAHDTVTVGAQVVNNTINMNTGKGTISVKGKFGRWKEISTAEYTAAINRGKTFKEAIPNYWTNRHADQINGFANGVGTVAGVTGGAVTFTTARRIGKTVVPTMRKEDIIRRHKLQQMQNLDEQASSDATADK